MLAHRGGWNQTPPSWSADGRWLAHVDWRGGLYQVIVASAGGGRSRVLHTTEAGVSFSWSPRGARMVVYENEEMFLAGPGAANAVDRKRVLRRLAARREANRLCGEGWISTGRIDGWNERRLVAGHAVSDVSRDGKRNETPAFITDLASRRVRQVGRGVPTWAPRSSRLGVQAIYDHPQLLTVVTPSGRQVGSLEVPYGYAWSPDGTKIVQEWTPEYAYVPMSLYVRGLGGRGRGRLLAQNADEPSWSADGRRVAFVRHDHTCRGTEVHVVGVTSRRTRKVIDCRPF